MPATNNRLAAMPADETQHQLLFTYWQQFRLTERRWTSEYILYFEFSIGFSCQAVTIKFPEQQQAVSVSGSASLPAVKQASTPDMKIDNW